MFRRGLPHFCSGIQTTSTSNPCPVLSFLLRNQKIRFYIGLDFITMDLCTEYCDYYNAGNWQLPEKQQWLRIQLSPNNPTAAGVQRAKPLLEGLYKTWVSLPVMLHYNLPSHPPAGAKETVHLQRYNTANKSTPSAPLTTQGCGKQSWQELPVSFMVAPSPRLPTYLISALHCFSEKLMALVWTGAGWEAACSPTRSVGDVSTARIFLALSAEAFWLRILTSILKGGKKKEKREKRSITFNK